jgi:hypothetical protein
MRNEKQAEHCEHSGRVQGASDNVRQQQEALWGKTPTQRSFYNSEVLPDAKAYGVGRVIHPGV